MRTNKSKSAAISKAIAATAPRIRGMAVAKKKALNVFLSGGKVSDCPYKGKAWRTVFCQEMQRLQQINLIE